MSRREISRWLIMALHVVIKEKPVDLRRQLMEGRASVPRVGSVAKVERVHPPFVVLDALLWQLDGLDPARKIRTLYEPELTQAWWMRPFGLDNWWRRAGGVAPARPVVTAVAGPAPCGARPRSAPPLGPRDRHAAMRGRLPVAHRRMGEQHGVDLGVREHGVEPVGAQEQQIVGDQPAPFEASKTV